MEIQEQTGPVFPDINDFSLERQRLERRRRIAQQLLGQQLGPQPGQMVGDFYVTPNPGQYFNAALQKVLASRDDTRLDEEEQALARREAEASNRMLSSIPDKPGPERLQAQVAAMRYPSLRESIKAQLMGDEAQAKRIEAGEQKAADRAFREAEDAKYKRTLAEAIALKQAPSVIVHTGGGGRGGAGIKAPSGYRYNEDGTALEPIPGGPADRSGAGAKPMTAAQEKAALALGADFATVNRLASTFKDEYSGDLRSSLQREFGKVAGGAAPQATQEMTRWWSDQAMMDELPTRHELFGAALTATEQKSWKDATISPNLSPEVIKKRLATRQEIMANAAERLRGSVTAGGRSGEQFDAATGKLKPTQAGASGSWEQAKPAQKTIVREVKLKDGRTGVEYSDGSRGFK